MPSLIDDLRSLEVMRQMQRLHLAACLPWSPTSRAWKQCHNSGTRASQHASFDCQPQVLGSDVADEGTQSFQHAFLDRRPQEFGSDAADTEAPSFLHALLDRRPQELGKNVANQELEGHSMPTLTDSHKSWKRCRGCRNLILPACLP